MVESGKLTAGESCACPEIDLGDARRIAALEAELALFRAAFSRISETAARVSAGDLEARLSNRAGFPGDILDTFEHLNHLLDVTDAFVREAVASLSAAASRNYYRQFLSEGMPGAFGTAATAIDQTRLHMQEMAAAEEAMLEAKARFLSNISHELRTPLNGIMGMAELLKGEDLSERPKSYIDMIRASGHVLDEQIANVLTYTQLTTTKAAIFRGFEDIRVLLGDIVEKARPAAEARGLSLVLHVDPEVPIWVKIDASKFSHVATNLISNGIKFTEQGLVEVMLSAQPTETVVWRVTLTIRDTGPGIPESIKPRLFQPFSVEDRALNRKYGGAGLGLATVSEIMAVSGGILEVESAEGSGTAIRAHVWLECRNELPRIP